MVTVVGAVAAVMEGEESEGCGPASRERGRALH